MDIKIIQLKHISILVILILSACAKPLDYRFEKKFKSNVDNENCKIDFI
jgi:hypothetical protein